MLKIKDLYISFSSGKDQKNIVSKVTFQLAKNRILGIVGESGSGKSITSMSIMRLLPKNAIVKGSITLDGIDLLNLTHKQFLNIRGNKIGMIFQEPMSSLNPTMKCGEQVAEVLRRHTDLKKQEIKSSTAQVRDHYLNRVSFTP